MYEEDRVRALELYEDIFDETDNETAVLQLLVSPTRQAVNLARAYDAKERRLQNDEEDAPAYLQVIEQIRRQAQALAPAAVRPEIPQPLPEEQKPAEEVSLDGFAFEPAEEKTDTAAPAPVPQEISAFPDEDRTTQIAPLTTLPEMAQENDKSAPQQNVDEFADAVEAFLADFNISDETIRTGSTAQGAAGTGTANTDGWAVPSARTSDEKDADWKLQAEEPAVTAAQQNQPEGQNAAALAPREPARKQSAVIPEQRTAAPEYHEHKKKVKKPVIALLILFVLLAVPIGLVLASGILGLALLSLSMGVTALTAGGYGLLSAFTAFPVFADVLLVFGLSLAAAGIGLLLFWIFIWLLFGGIPGLVRWICALARKLCYKEVAA